MADFTTAEIETGDGLSTAVVFSTVADATTRIATYGRAADRAAWIATGVDEDARKAAMQRAVLYMTNKYNDRWKGERTSKTQALPLPRYNLDDGEFDIASNVVPQAIIDASIDLAPRELGNDLQSDLDDAGSIEREKVKVGDIEEDITYSGGKSGQKEYTAIDETLAPYLRDTEVLQRA